MRNNKGFTLIELLIVVVIIGILAAIAIPNYVAMKNRAQEGSTKSNMHTFQLAAEDYAAQNMGAYANLASTVSAGMPSGGATFKNPFDRTTANAYADKAWVKPLVPTATSGMVSYADSSVVQYQIAAQGKSAALSLILTSGQ